MRRTLLIVCLLLAPALVPAPAPAGQVEQGCTAIDGGYRCLYGPFKVDPGPNEIGVPAPAPPAEGYVTSMRATVVDEDGDRLSHHMVHLHHAVWLNPTAYDVTCPTYPERFFASGKERTRVTLPEGMGYYWSNRPPLDYGYGPTWILLAHLDGMHEGMTHDAFVRLDMDFVAGEQGALTDVRPVWLDVENCENDPVFDVARGSGTGRRYTRVWDYEMPLGGRFVAMGGHLHDGGIKLGLRNLTTDQPVFTSEASYDKANDPWYLTAMGSFSSADGPAVARGDVLRLKAVYDSTHRWRDVMGIMVGMLVPEPDA